MIFQKFSGFERALKLNCVASSRINPKFSKLREIANDVTNSQSNIYLKHSTGSLIFTDKKEHYPL